MELDRRAGADRIRASDAERQQVEWALGQAAGEGRLTLDEYAERIDRLNVAKTRSDLVPLTEDLPESAGRPQPQPSTGLRTKARKFFFAFLSTYGQRAAWLVPARIAASALFGKCILDFRHARIGHPITKIRSVAAFGAVELWVPEGVDVLIHGVAVVGVWDSLMKQPPTPGAPVIELSCLAFCGSVKVFPATPDT